MEQTISGRRQYLAENALAGLGKHRSEHQRLSVRCTHSHHLAAVYETKVGLVYYGGLQDTEYVDLLAGDETSSDRVPARCACGPHALSRSDLLAAAADTHIHTVRVL